MLTLFRRRRLAGVPLDGQESLALAERTRALIEGAGCLSGNLMLLAAEAQRRLAAGEIDGAQAQRVTAYLHEALAGVEGACLLVSQARDALAGKED